MSLCCHGKEQHSAEYVKGIGKICSEEQRISPYGYLMLLLHDGCQRLHQCWSVELMSSPCTEGWGMWCSFPEGSVPGLQQSTCVWYICLVTFLSWVVRTHPLCCLHQQTVVPLASCACCFENWCCSPSYEPNLKSLDLLHQNLMRIMISDILIHFQSFISGGFASFSTNLFIFKISISIRYQVTQ